jgi:epoxyqueuosine reductase
MIRKPFGWTGSEVARIGQGTWDIPESGARRQEAVAALRRGIELGMTHIDTAEMYGGGRVEEIVGEAIAGIDRAALFLTTKVLPSNASYDGTIAACERSLRALGTEYVDLYLLHWPSAYPIRETMRAFEALVQQGKTRFIGVSNFDVDELAAAQAALERERLAANQVLYHLGERGIETRLMPYCAQHGIALVGYTPFGRSRFAAAENRNGVLARIAAKHGKTIRQVILNVLTSTHAPLPFRKRRAWNTSRKMRALADGILTRRTSLQSSAPIRCMMDRWQPSDLERFKRIACESARELGACRTRVTSASEHREARAAMSAAFSRGDFTTWRYDDRYAAHAASPQTLLSGARAVVCMAFAYAGAAPDRKGPLDGRVSNYAWPEDYHRTLKGVLRRIADRIDDAAGAPVTAIACDTKPIAERAFAARSGLGWVGKHTNLIVPESGSFVFLGEIITTLDLPPDAPLQKHCGSCTRCVTACPTGALRGDYTIDASRCISDLTQRTDAIPRAMRPLIGTWVWGCDLCQLACPPNRAARRAAAEGAQPHPERSSPALAALLQLRSGEFRRRYAGSAMGWRGAAILRRNAAVALGNTLDRASVPALAQALAADPHRLVRGHAAWALGRIGSPAALRALRRVCEVEGDASVCEEARAALEPYERTGALQER